MSTTLLFGQDLRYVVIDAEGGRDGLGDPAVVPGEHADPEAQAVQPSDGAFRRSLRAVGEREHPEHVALCRKQDGSLALPAERLEALSRMGGSV